MPTGVHRIRCGVPRQRELADRDLRGLPQGTDDVDGGFGVRDMDVDAPAVVAVGVRGPLPTWLMITDSPISSSRWRRVAALRGDRLMVHMTSTPSSSGMAVWMCGILDVVAVQAVKEFALEFFAQDRGAKAIKDQEHPHSAGINHVGGVQGVQLVLGADHRGEGSLRPRRPGQGPGHGCCRRRFARRPQRRRPGLPLP